MTNFDISRYDVKRICSSSTLIASDLAKRSPKDTAPSAPAGNHFTNTCPSPQPLLAISSGCAEPSDELSDMVWSANPDDRPQPENSSTTENNATLVTSSSRSPSNPQSPKCSFGATSNEFGVADYSHAYFSLHGGAKFEDGGGGNEHSRLGNLGLVQQVPMFALWSE